MEVKRDTITEILGRWRYDPANLIEILQDVQERFRHIPYEAAQRVSWELEVPLSRIFHIATFYKEFTLEPRGKIHISVCTGTACHVKGGSRILENIMRDLGVDEEGKATPDGLFSVESVRCLGCCGLAPVVAVGQDVQARTTSVKVGKLVDRLRRQARGQ